MDYNLLLDVTTELGYRLAMSGAETYRIEESINRIMSAYNVKSEVFAIPNCLHVNIKTSEGLTITRMQRIGLHGNDLHAVELFSNLSRKICAVCPEPQTALQWLKDAVDSQKSYNLPTHLLGNFLGACGFCVLFGGSFIDSLSAGVCGVLVGAICRFMDKQKANYFFKTITASFFMAVLAYLTGMLVPAQNTDTVIIGALMILVPGLLFTNALRDIIHGDTNSGINRIVQVLLIAAAIALGTGAAWTVYNTIWTIPPVNPVINHSLLIEAIASSVGCAGFVILFNIHGKGLFLCILGGVLTWVTFRIALYYTGNDIVAYFWATVVASFYSEIMARIRKYPAISYLTISAFPLIPGAGVYYTTQHVVNGDMASFANQGTHTIAIAGIMAVGILLTSTFVRMIADLLNHKKYRLK